MIGAARHAIVAGSGYGSISPLELVYSRSYDNEAPNIPYITNSSSGNTFGISTGDVGLTVVYMRSGFGGYLEDAEAIYQSNSKYDVIYSKVFGNRSSLMMVYAATATVDQDIDLVKGPNIAFPNYSGETSFIMSYYLLRNVNGYALRANTNPDTTTFPYGGQTIQIPITYQEQIPRAPYFVVHTSAIGEYYRNQSLGGSWTSTESTKIQGNDTDSDFQRASSLKTGTWNNPLQTTHTGTGNYNGIPLSMTAIQVW